PPTPKTLACSDGALHAMQETVAATTKHNKDPAKPMGTENQTLCNRPEQPDLKQPNESAIPSWTRNQQSQVLDIGCENRLVIKAASAGTPASTRIVQAEYTRIRTRRKFC
ncbi:MAG: hypothetical protein AAF386_04855, partial [Pseudomonadota bacterium]